MKILVIEILYPNKTLPVIVKKVILMMIHNVKNVMFSVLPVLVKVINVFNVQKLRDMGNFAIAKMVIMM